LNRELLRWQTDEIKKGIEEADRNEFASEHEVQKVLKKWNTKKSSNDEQANRS